MRVRILFLPLKGSILVASRAYFEFEQYVKKRKSKAGIEEQWHKLAPLTARSIARGVLTKTHRGDKARQSDNSLAIWFLFEALQLEKVSNISK